MQEVGICLIITLKWLLLKSINSLLFCLHFVAVLFTVLTSLYSLKEQSSKNCGISPHSPSCLSAKHIVVTKMFLLLLCTVTSSRNLPPQEACKRLPVTGLSPLALRSSKAAQDRASPDDGQLFLSWCVHPGGERVTS